MVERNKCQMSELYSGSGFDDARCDHETRKKYLSGMCGTPQLLGKC